MKNLFVYIIAFFFIQNISNAQELPVYSQYLLNDFFLNPAKTGNFYMAKVAISDRHQWFGFDDAPNLQEITAAMRVKKIGLGFGIFNDNNGAVNRKTYKLSYAYHIKLGKSKSLRFKETGQQLSFGLSIQALSLSINKKELENGMSNDPLLANLQSNIALDADFGIEYTGKHFFSGLSVGHLAKPSLGLKDSKENNQLSRVLFVYLGYNFALNPILELQPSILYRLTDNADQQPDINLLFCLKDKYSFGFSIRKSLENSTTANSAIQFLCKLNLRKYFDFAYVYEYGIGGIARYTSGSHEILLSYKLPMKKNVFVCPAYR